MSHGHVSNERLIALVQERPPLYDNSHPAHCNRDVTGYLWAQIAAQLDTSEVLCKTKWANLRSNFVRELRRIRPSEDGTIWPPQWPLFKPLMFLLPYLKTRGSLGIASEEPAILPLDFHEALFEGRQHTNEDFSVVPTKNKKIRLESVPPEEEDDDKWFMLSLVPKMRKLPTTDNLSFRIEVQQLLLNRLRQLGEETSSRSDTVEALIHEDKTENYNQVLRVKAETGAEPPSSPTCHASNTS